MDTTDKTCNAFNDSTGRREFIKRASSLLAGTAISRDFGTSRLLSASVPLQPPSATSTGPVTVNGLPASRLGRTGLDVTKISFGGMLTSEPNILLHALDKGINFIHTSPAYQNGASLASYGKVLKEHRARVIVAIREQPELLNRVLPVLNTDYVDIVMPSIQNTSALRDERLLENFQQAKQAGKCRYLGFACHSNMTSVLEKAADMGIFDVVLISYMNTDDPWFFRSLRLARAAGMGIIAMKGLPVNGENTFKGDNLTLVNTLCGDMLNRWYADSVMASMDGYQSVDGFMRILDGRLSLRDEQIKEKWLAHRQQSHCAMCGKCDSICPEGIEISRVLRYQMYESDYEQDEYARSCYASLETKVDPERCLSCRLCENVCSRGLPVAEMLSDAHNRLG
jgi:uncharacterized protein